MEKYYNLTNPQKNIFEIEKTLLGINNACNILLSSIKFNTRLDCVKLEKTLNKLIECNDSFRIKLIKQEDTVKQYFEKYKYEKIEILEIAENDFENYINNLKEQPMDIYNKLYDLKIILCGTCTYVIYRVHHIINDAWGITEVAEQIKEIYSIIDNNDSVEHLDKPSYVKIIDKNIEYNKSDKYKRDKEFWDEYIKRLSTEKIFNRDISDTNSMRHKEILNNEVYTKIKEYCIANKISEYTFFLAIISIYFLKIYNLQNINIGTPFLNRNKKELQTIGLFISNLPLNIQLEQNNLFKSLCETIYRDNFRIFKHSNFPYTDIQKLYAEMNAATNLFEIGFSYQINTLKTKVKDDFGETTWYFTNKQNNPITIHLSQMSGYLEIYYDYIVSIFTAKEIKTMHEIIIDIINQVLAVENIKIKDINIITENEKRKLIEFNNTGKTTIKPITVGDIFDTVCKKYSKNIAIKCKQEEITYAEFYNKVCSLANILRENGVKRNTAVALFFDKSIEMIISMFAVIKAGGCYIPILPEENIERIKYILDDSNPVCILTTDDYKEYLKGKGHVLIVNKDNLKSYNIEVNNINSNNDLIYIIYTSGSTGNPKGTKLMHKNICGLLYSMTNSEILKPTSKDVSMSLLKYSFDASGIDIYSAILSGGKLVLISKDDEHNPNKVIEIMEKERVTRTFLVPKWLEHINTADRELNANLSTLKVIGTGGESFKPKVVKNLYYKYPNLKILNLYGPTEATMFATYSVINCENIEKNSVSIGKPIPYSRAIVVNSFGDVLPCNRQGELILFEDNTSINNIAEGYVNLKEITESKFIKIKNILNNNEEVRAYRTGDIVKINDSLEIEYVGRTDDVVKINNGYLVSINEVEAKIDKVIGDKFKFSVVDINTNTSKALVLFVQTTETLDVAILKKHINSKLSFYMRIKDIIEIKELPEMCSGKINKKELKSIANEKIANKEIILPKTKTQKRLYEIIKKQCNLERFSITDDFIDDLAIDSLNMTVIYSFINNSKLKMQDMYTYTTIEELSKIIDNELTNINDLQVENVIVENNVKKFNMENILLTGATGFLGIHLLIELLKNDNVKRVYCLVRSKENISSNDRLYNKLKYYKLADYLSEKLEIIDGDIAKEDFGLDKQHYLFLQQQVTTVVNSAANVKHYGKYEKFYNTNVKSTENIMKFCGEGISLAHISTLSIAGFKNEKTEQKVFDENTLYIKQDFCNNPYLTTKFLAEQKLLNTGLNVKIFRLGNIMPRISDGMFQENYNQNAFMSAIRLILKLKQVPKEYMQFKVEFSPVDECAESIVKLINTDCQNKVFHIVNENEIYIKDIVNMLNDDIAIVNQTEFMNKLNNYEEIGSEYIKEYILQNNLNAYSITNTIKMLQENNFKWSKTDKAYINNLVKIIKDNRW